LKQVQRARKRRSLFLIDIAVPRDVDPAVLEIEHVYLYDIDDLTRVVAQTLGGRAAQAERAAAIVREEASSYEIRQAQRAMAPVIVALRERTRSTLHRELERTLRSRLRHLGNEEREALEVMLDAAISKLWHEPTVRLKAAASHPQAPMLLDAVSELFALDEEPESLSTPSVNPSLTPPIPTLSPPTPGPPRSGAPTSGAYTDPPVSQPLVDLDSVDEHPDPSPEAPPSTPELDPASLREPPLPREFRTREGR
jgi:glutamyl-tRNA reductase